MGYVILFCMLTIYFITFATTTTTTTSNRNNNIETGSSSDGDDGGGGEIIHSPYNKHLLYARNSHLKNHTYKLLSRRSIVATRRWGRKIKNYSKLRGNGLLSLRSATLEPSVSATQDVTQDVARQGATKDDITTESTQSPVVQEVDGSQRTSDETVVVGGQRAAQEMSPENAQGAQSGAQDPVIDPTQGAAAIQETEVSPSEHSDPHEPLTDESVHKISPQADIISSPHNADITLPTTTLHGKESSYIAIENRISANKNIPPQAMMFNAGSSSAATNDGPMVLPKHFADVSHQLLPPLSHLAQNVSDVDIEEETPNQMLASTDDVKNVDHVTGLQEIKEIKQVPKHLSDDKLAAHIEDDEKVFSITHPILKPNEYNENLKEMLAKTKADLSAIKRNNRPRHV